MLRSMVLYSFFMIRNARSLVVGKLPSDAFAILSFTADMFLNFAFLGLGFINIYIN